MPKPIDPEVQKLIDKINTKAKATVATGLVVAENAMVEISAGDLRSIASTNPNHPSSVVFLNATKGVPAGVKISVEQVQIDAITQNMHVVEDINADGNIVKVLSEPTTTTPYPDQEE